MDHFKHIYQNKASEYHRMIAVEDVENNLLNALQTITSWDKKTVLDLGSGTGRFPLIFRHHPLKFFCLDLHMAMLRENKIQRNEMNGKWTLVQGDMRGIPFKDACVDIVIAGWAIGHLRAWYANEWQQQMRKIIKEMLRTAKTGCPVIICETMSTGSLEPKPPVPDLAEYYHWLENEHGFSRLVIATDYLFSTVDQAVEYTQFFFGEELAEQIRKNQWARLPEWTGIWHRYKQNS